MMPSLYETVLKNDGNQPPAGRPERRGVDRQRLRDAPGTLSWSVDGEQVHTAMMVVDISGAGAALVAEGAPPPLEATAWMTLESGAAGPDPLEARVVATAVDPFGKHIVRLHFTSWLPLGNVLEQHEEHRMWQRYPARERRASLIWIERSVETAHPGELINISGGGAAVITDAAPPREEPIWLTLAVGSEPMTPVECRLVAASVDASGLKVARFRFVEACPMDLFELAVHGAPLES